MKSAIFYLFYYSNWSKYLINRLIRVVVVIIKNVKILIYQGSGSFFWLKRKYFKSSKSLDNLAWKDRKAVWFKKGVQEMRDSFINEKLEEIQAKGQELASYLVAHGNK